MVNRGTLAGATATPVATASSSTDTPAVATLRHGSNFSAAISPETTSIQVRLITPSANSATISAQQHPGTCVAGLELPRRVDRLRIVVSGDHDGGIEGVGDIVSNSLAA
jgi:hypothetical protein